MSDATIGAEADEIAYALPGDFGLTLDPSVRRTDGGRVLIGGSPLKLLRLTEAGARVVDALARGEVVGSSPARQRLARRLLDGGLAHPRPPSSPFGPEDVTCVILAHEEADAGDLTRTLRAIAATHPTPPRVLVVDDGSSPAGVAVVEGVAREHDVEAVLRPVNGGPAAARNTGLEHVTTPVVVFVDCDVEPEPGWLTALLPHFADPQVVIAAPRVRATDGIALLDVYERGRSPLDLGPLDARVAPGTRVAYVPSTAIAVRVDALVPRDGAPDPAAGDRPDRGFVGSFDEALRVGEDVDLVWRAVEAGRTVRYEPRAVVRHPARRTWRRWAAQRASYGTSAALLDTRHPGAVPPLAVSGWSALAWAAAALDLPGLGLIVAGATTAALPRRLGPLEHPWAEAVRLAGRGHLLAWRPLASAVTRTWWPLALPAALVSRRARRAVVLAAVAPALVDWLRGERPTDPVRYVAIRVADDVAYGTGVWLGCWRERTTGPLRPDLRSWPGRRPSPDD